MGGSAAHQPLPWPIEKWSLRSLRSLTALLKTHGCIGFSLPVIALHPLAIDGHVPVVVALPGQTLHHGCEPHRMLSPLVARRDIEKGGQQFLRRHPFLLVLVMDDGPRALMP